MGETLPGCDTCGVEVGAFYCVICHGSFCLVCIEPHDVTYAQRHQTCPATIWRVDFRDGSHGHYPGPCHDNDTGYWEVACDGLVSEG